ncbi:hypothetical protein IFM89_027052 [Coptis chinensis]|uniref:DUF4283 domain-containing protein n=1 Tax=Coptis chinensis TaxID=261450 RepID=A0A835LKL4_9MAGN|nr:hypothetical protein IFM89_027052 [Coptis chinensis]
MIADKDLFYFKFINDEDRQLVLENGPIFLAGRIFEVRTWSPEVEQQRNKIKVLPIWVKINLPKLFWMKNGIDFVSSLIRKPICMDEATANRTRISYARVCVVVDINFTFPSSIPVEMDEGNIIHIGLEYDWEPKKCSFCSIFGHTDVKCVKNKDKQPIAAAKEVSRAKPTKEKYKQQKQRWAQKGAMLQGQSSATRDENGVIATVGHQANAPIIIPNSTEQQSNLIDDTNVNEATNPENLGQQGETTFEEVRTEFEPAEIVIYNNGDENEIHEGETEEATTYVGTRKQFLEDSYSTSEGEVEKEYFSDHNSIEDTQGVVAGLLNTPVEKGTTIKSKQLSELSDVISLPVHKPKKRKTKGKPKGAGKN